MQLAEQSVSTPEALSGQAVSFEDFFLVGDENLSKWKTEIWPKLQELFRTTWPQITTPENEEFLREKLQEKGSGAILMRDPLTQNILGFSMVDSDNESQVGAVYNSTVIVDQRLRGQGLMVPLLEKQMEQATGLGYEYMWGIYNANTGVMPDGRTVQNGFAHKIKNTAWQHGTVVYSAPHNNPKHGNQEYIVFHLGSAIPPVRPSRRN